MKGDAGLKGNLFSRSLHSILMFASYHISFLPCSLRRSRLIRAS